MGYTIEEKKEYFKNLREEWAALKKELTEEKITTFDAIMQANNFKVSPVSFYFVLLAMQRHKLDGIPYIDCKTFEKWKESGFMVKKGEKSKIRGITWIKVNDDDDDDKFIFPKQYNLFHKSQVEAI